MKKYCFGIDVGGTSIKCGLFQTDGLLLDKWEIPTRTADKGTAILPDVAETIAKKIVERDIDKDDVEGVGIGIPGPVNDKGEVFCAVNLYWGFTPVAKQLSDLTGLPARAGNDANVAALGEAWKGAAEGASDVIMVTLGTGVGGGIIVNGQIISGSKGGAGEIGHICVNKDETEKCSCGKTGCLEQYASATGIVRMAKEKLHRYDITAKDIFDEAKAGDTLSLIHI